MKKYTPFAIAPVILFLSVVLSGCVELDKLKSNLKNNELGQSDIAEGLKEALRVGSATVVSNLGRNNGFNNDKVAHIVLPDNLEKIRNVLQQVGYSQKLDDLELKINRAAELATPKAKAIFVTVIKQMAWQDAKQIYNGPNDAATRYFQQKMTPALSQEMKPVINTALAQVGVVRSYNDIVGKYNKLPFVTPVRSDLGDYTLNKTLAAIFHYVAIEEMAIRNDPAKRTTEILKRVFGSK